MEEERSSSLAIFLFEEVERVPMASTSPRRVVFWSKLLPIYLRGVEKFPYS